MTMIIDGTNGLTFNNATTQASAGVVLQVVNVAFTTYTNTNSTTFVDMSGATASITPKFSTSKILVLINLAGVTKNNGGTSGSCGSFQLLRGSTMIVSWDNFSGYNAATTTASAQSSTSYLDSPATTSATTYKVQWGNSSGGTIQINNYNGILGYSTSTITLMEIAG
jgi:hypothetical protein